MNITLVRRLTAKVLHLMCAIGILAAFGAAATPLDLSGNISYNITGSTVVLRADRLQNNAAGGLSGSIRLELWAFTSPYSGSASGYKLASYPLAQLRGGYYYTGISSGSIAFQSPPPGRYYFAIMAREYDGSGSDGYVTRDWLNFNTPVRVAGGAQFEDVQIIGLTRWQTSGNSLNIQVEKVRNACDLGSSGSLRLDLWATESPYSGGRISGYRVGSVPLNPLPSGYAYNDINKTVSYSRPPDGGYYFTLTLAEYHNGEYLIVDYLSYDNYQLIGDPPGTPSIRNATDITSGGFVANWSAASRASGYLVDVSTSSTFDSYVPGYYDYDVGNSLSWYVNGLEPGTTYYYRVRAYNDIGTSGNSGAATVRTPPVPPNAPSTYLATGVTSSGFTANWGGVPGVDGYKLDVSMSPSFGSYVAGYQNLDVGNSLSRAVTKLAPNTAYYYRVRTYNKAGTSANSGAEFVSTPANYTITVGATPSAGGTVTGGGTWSEGSSRTVTARPARRYTFAHWSENGTIVSSAPDYSFILDRNRQLAAHFEASPFVIAAGTYSGICRGAGIVTHENSGSIALKVTDGAGFSGKLVLGGKPYSFSGLFDGTGYANYIIERKGLAPLYLNLRLDLAGNDLLDGSIGDGTHTLAEISAYRSPYSKAAPTPDAGKYTFVIPQDTTAPGHPGGPSIGTLTIDASGKAKVQLALADGTKTVQSVFLSKDRHLLFYALLYGKQGHVSGWLQLETRAGDDLHGITDWIKPTVPGAKYYPGGFTINRLTTGSRYVPPQTGERVLNLTNPRVEFSGGNLAQGLMNAVRLEANNKVENLGTEPMTLSLTVATGEFKGTITDPVSRRKLPFQGVVLQKSIMNFGNGFFLGISESGEVRFEEQ